MTHQDGGQTTSLDEIRIEVEALCRRAAATGRPLPTVPDVQIGSRSRVVSVEPARIQLSRDLLAIPAEDRVWTIAHELSHVLRITEGTPRPRSAAYRGWVMAMDGILAAAGGVFLSWLVLKNHVLLMPLPAFLALALVALWFALVALERAEETECDRAATLVFGEVLSPAGVLRIERDQGRLSRVTPTGLRHHLRPADRRHLGLELARADGRNIEP